MQTEIMVAGFGGQGVLFAGELIARAAMDAGLHVTWFPAYGPEMRGGTANCVVIISDDEIGSPVVRHPQVLLAMNLPSLDKYEPLLQKDGTLIVNASLVNRAVKRPDLISVIIPASEIAERIAEKKLTNMVMVGAFVAKQNALTLSSVMQALEESLPSRHSSLLQANLQAINEGYVHAARS